MAERLLSTAEAAAELDVSASRVRQYIENNQLPAQKIGHVWAIRLADVKKLKKLPKGTPGKARSLGG